MINIVVRDWTPDDEDTLMTVEDWEDGVALTVFTDDDGYGCFCDPANNSEMRGFDVYPSDIGSPEYERYKKVWSHINWFNK